MDRPELLAIYLRDHLAAAVGGTELVDRMRKSAEGAERTALDDLGASIRDDRQTLKAVLAALDVEPSAVKSGAAWFAEKLGRLKLNGRLVEQSPLSRVLELEGLILAITGKISLWRVLRRVAAADVRLADFDFEALLDGAHAQRLRVEQLHEGAVDRAFR